MLIPNNHNVNNPIYGARALTPITFIEILVDCLVDISTEKLPDRVRLQAKLSIFDFAASVLAGVSSAEADAGRAMLPMFGAGSCPLIAESQTASVFGAAFYHSLVATVADVDDSHCFASGLHLSATIVPPALALGEAQLCSSDTLIRAVLAGYEVSSRISRAVDKGMRRNGFHATGTVGPFGACAAACVMLGLQRPQIVNAFGIAASAGGGIFAFQPEGSSVRHAHGAWASVNGLASAVMAQHGITGPAHALEGKDGFLSAYAGDYQARFIRAPVPSHSGKYEIENIYRKLFSACGHSLPAITAALDVRAQIADYNEIERIEVLGYAASARLTNANPTSVGAAKFSMPFIVALAILFGDVSDREMQMDILDRGDVRALAAKISVVEDPAIDAEYPQLRSAELRIHFSNGSQLVRHVDVPIGLPGNPARLDQLVEKFVGYGQGHLSPQSVETMTKKAVDDMTAKEVMGLLTVQASTHQLR